MAEPRLHITVGPQGIERIQVDAPDEETKDESTCLCISLLDSLIDLDAAATTLPRPPNKT